MAAAIFRKVFSNTATSPLFLTKRLLSSSSFLPRLLVHHPLRTPPTLLSHAVRVVSLHPAQFNSICYATFPPRNLDSKANRQFIFMQSPFTGREKANLQQLMDYYIQTLAKVVGSEEEAKKKIYRASYLGFGCEIDTETLNKLEDFQGVRFVFPDNGLGRERYDLEHWFVLMDPSFRKQITIDIYIQTLARVVGSEEEAKKKIYSVSCGDYFGFGCEIDVKTVEALGGQFAVRYVFPDYMFHLDMFVDHNCRTIEGILRKRGWGIDKKKKRKSGRGACLEKPKSDPDTVTEADMREAEKISD